MDLNSRLFDSIRIRKPSCDEPKPAAEALCESPGCTRPGPHRAPKGRKAEGQYWRFCIDHVRAYNASYNYFDGMSDAAVQDFQKDALTGHRPTWKVGVNASAPGAPSAKDGAAGPTDSAGFRTMDPHGFFAKRAKAAREEPAQNRRQLKPLEKKSLQALDLKAESTKVEIKARFKELVKIYHPDANGGDARSGDKLREIIQAYNYLKQAGLV